MRLEVERTLQSRLSEIWSKKMCERVLQKLEIMYNSNNINSLEATATAVAVIV